MYLLGSKKIIRCVAIDSSLLYRSAEKKSAQLPIPVCTYKERETSSFEISGRLAGLGVLQSLDPGNRSFTLRLRRY